MDEIDVEIKQEQYPLVISPEIIKTDMDNIVKTEYQYCTNYNDCSNNFPNENGLILGEETLSLGVIEENSVNKIDIDQHKFPTHVILKCKEDYDESAFKQWVKEEQRIEGGENDLDEKILEHQKLDLLKISPKAVTDIKTEIDLDNIVAKSEGQFRINCVENSSDTLQSENGLVSKDYSSVEVAQSSEIFEAEYDSNVVRNLVNKIDYDQQNVSGQAFCQENVGLQTDVKLKQEEKKEKGNRNKTSIREEKKHKCLYCDYETQNTFHLKKHVSAIHEKGNAKVYCCQQCTYKTVRADFLRVHHSRAHKKKALHKCPGCEKSLTQKVHLDNHLLMNHDSLQNLITYKIHYCKFCTYKTVFSKNLLRHINYNHKRDNAEKFQCPKCDYFDLQKCNLTRHLLVHSSTRPYLCTVCHKGFNRKTNLESHILTNHKENADLLKSITSKIHQCTLCPYKTMNSRNLHRHMEGKHKQI